jgi:YVTN family beta-propeller protein
MRPIPIPKRRWPRTGRRATLLLLSVSALVVAALAAPLPSKADGGAPNLAYVAGGGTNGGDLVVIDIGKRRVTGHVTLGGAPQGVVLSPDGRFAYVAQSAANRVAVVDTRSQRVAGTLPTGPGPVSLVLGFAGSKPILYVADSSGNTVTVLDLDAQRTLATIPVGQHPTGLALAGPDTGIRTPNDSELYVAAAGSNTVSVISAAQRQVVATLPVPGGPVGVVVPPTGGVAYVSTSAGTVVALALADRRVLGTVLHMPGGALGTMDYDAVTGQIYVPEATTGVVAVLRPVAVGGNGSATVSAAPAFPTEPVRRLQFGGGPAAVAITFDGAYGFVAERDAGRVAMLDVGSRQLLATIAVGGAPQAVITGPYPPAVSGPTAFLITMGVILFIVVLLGLTLISSRQRPATKQGDTESQAERHKPGWLRRRQPRGKGPRSVGHGPPAR